ncbi:hypothetical protein BDZ89DRAFT_1078286 [Hymenopellis radicata]|nr:hypothetical protein BDZ89DRAFT_1078286 [Hymenopellis radicata]
MLPADLSLPPELLTTIFQELDGHRQTLRACALVCSAWTGASRALLFNHVNIPPHLNGLIRYLEISIIDNATHLEKVLSIVDSLIGLRTVELHCVLWSNVDVPLERLLLALSHLDSLRTVFVDNESAGHIGCRRSFKFVFQALSGSHVSRIGLYGINITKDGGDEGAVVLPSSLKTISLDLEGASLKLFANWFTTPLPLPNVEIYLLMLKEIPSVNEVLSTRAFSSVTHLRISFSMLDAMPHTFPETLNISRFSRVFFTVNIYTSHRISQQGYIGIIKLWAATFSELAPDNTISELILTFYSKRGLGKAVETAWASLDVALVGENMRRLESIRFEDENGVLISPENGNKHWRDQLMLRKLLPWCHKKQLVL